MADSMDKLKKLYNILKDKRIKISYPENLEGDSFKIEMDISSEKDVEVLAFYLQEKLDKLKELIKLIKRGG